MLTSMPWHRIAAVLFVVRFPLVLPLLTPSLRADPAVIFGIAALHAAIAVGYLVRNRIAIWLGLYAAMFSLVSPFLYAGITPNVVTLPWLAVNTPFCIALTGVAFGAWRQMRTNPA